MRLNIHCPRSQFLHTLNKQIELVGVRQPLFDYRLYDVVAPARAAPPLNFQWGFKSPPLVLSWNYT